MSDFQVPLVLPDLRREENLASVLMSINHLSKVSEHIFSTIEGKCDQFHCQIDGFNKRVNDASAKIEALKIVKKATVVFSSARYPGTSSRSYREAFPKDVVRTNYKNAAPIGKLIAVKLQEFNTKTLQQKLQFYSFKAKQEEEAASGLCPTPQGLSSVCSLTVFNTAQSPYVSGQVTEDPLVARTRARARTRLDQNDANLEDVPALHGDMGDGGGEIRDMFYLPEMGDMPEFDLPDYLELPNIASDLQFKQSGSDPAIVPTLNIADLPDDIVGDLPDISVDATTQGVKEVVVTSIEDQQPAFVPPPPPAQFAMVPPAPPPPPLTPTPAPPPAPMSAQPPPPTTVITLEKSENFLPTSAPSSGDGRFGLLEAIRSAGGASGAGLKSIKERKVAERQRRDEEKEASPPSSGGDLMGDLMSKLTMRRKGISGSKVETEASSGGGGGAMDKISLMIPPPPGNDQDQGSGEGSDDGDWD